MSYYDGMFDLYMDKEKIAPCPYNNFEDVLAEANALDDIDGNEITYQMQIAMNRSPVIPIIGKTQNGLVGFWNMTVQADKLHLLEPLLLNIRRRLYYDAKFVEQQERQGNLYP